MVQTYIYLKFDILKYWLSISFLATFFVYLHVKHSNRLKIDYHDGL